MSKLTSGMAEPLTTNSAKYYFKASLEGREEIILSVFAFKYLDALFCNSGCLKG